MLSEKRENSKNERDHAPQSEDKKEYGGYGVTPKQEIAGSDADIDNGGESSLKRDETSKEITGSDADQDRDGSKSLDKDNFLHIKDSYKPKRSSWNSITFDKDDFLETLAPA